MGPRPVKLTQPSLLSQLLQLLPRRLLVLLDQWSYRKALARAEQRRQRSRP